MATQVSNEARLALSNKLVDFTNDTFKIILMDTGFTFDPDTHDGYADVSANELSTGNGYTAGGATLTGVSVVRNDATDRTDITWNNATWTALSGPIGPSPGSIIYDDTVTAGLVSADVIIGYIDFGTDQTEPDGGVATIANPKVTV